MSAVLEQVANFDATDYAVDGVGDEEVQFETLLKFDRRGGFTLDQLVLHADKSTMKEETVQILLHRIQSLGGPKLLDKKCSLLKDSDEDEAPVKKPSFCSDRRMIRLLIARYWADALVEKFKTYQQERLQEDTSLKVEVNEEENQERIKRRKST